MFRHLADGARTPGTGIGVTDEDRRKVGAGLQYLKERPEVLTEEWFRQANSVGGDLRRELFKRSEFAAIGDYTHDPDCW